MPYIVTTKRPRRSILEGPLPMVTLSRHAAATLDDAQHLAFCAIDRASKLDREMNSDEQRHDRKLRLAVRFDIADGGTVGPLPDGTVITVRRASERDLLDAIGVKFAVTAEGSTSVVDAYNAAQV